MLRVHSLSDPTKVISRFSTLTPEDQPHAFSMLAAEIILLPTFGGPLLLLCSNRKSPLPEGDTVALFAVDPEDGSKVERTRQGWLKGFGKHIRGANADQTGKYVAIAGRDSGGLTILEWNGEGGMRLEEVARLGVDGVLAPVWMRS